MRGESKYHYVDLALIDDPNGGQTGEHLTDGGVEAGETLAGRR